MWKCQLANGTMGDHGTWQTRTKSHTMMHRQIITGLHEKQILKKDKLLNKKKGKKRDIAYSGPKSTRF